MILIGNEKDNNDDVVVGCLCKRKDKFLFLKRHREKSFPNCWCVPGGKVCGDETPTHGVLREVKEETGISDITDLRLLYIYHVDHGGFKFDYHLYLAEFDDPPKVILNSEEHAEYGWFPIEEGCRLSLVPDMREILNHAKKLLSANEIQLDLFIDRYDDLPISSYYDRSVKQPVDTARIWFASYGPPSSGKTTTLKEIVRYHPQYQLVNHSFKILNANTRLNKYLSKCFVEEDRRFYFHFQMEILPLRFLYTRQCQNHDLVDETIFSTLAYSITLKKLNWLTEDEFQTFMFSYKIYQDLLPPPKETLYFTCAPDIAISRMLARGRNIEKSYSKEYMYTLYESFAEAARMLENRYSFHIIDTSGKKTNEVAAECYEILR